MDQNFLLKFANQEVHWIARDQPDIFQRNLKFRRADLENNGWVDATITYKFNNYGFRCDQFNNDPSVVFLGCSHTFGVGLPLECTWPYLVAKSLNLQCYNLGLPGTSNDTAFRLAYYWLKKLNPKMVILGQVDASRFEVLDNNSMVRFNSWLYDINILSQSDKMFYKRWVTTSDNYVLNVQKNVLAIQQICSDLNIIFKVVDSKFFVESQVDLARDLIHSGKVTNKNFSDYVLTHL